jgi:dienelactone hydrolase
MFTFKHTASAAVIGLMALATSAQAVTLAEVSKDGPFDITTEELPGSGYGAAQIHVPKQAGTYPLVAAIPGFVSAQGTIRGFSKRLATHGFVTISISTNTLVDFPTARANQLLASLKAGLASSGAAKGKIDGSSMAVSGWSMGGGGTLEAINKTPNLKAGVAWAPWDLSPAAFRTIKVPSFIVGASADIIAPVSGHSKKFYDAIPATTPKVLAVLDGNGHFFPLITPEPAAYSYVAWNKKYTAGDNNYGQFLTDLGDKRWKSYDSAGY